MLTVITGRAIGTFIRRTSGLRFEKEEARLTAAPKLRRLAEPVNCFLPVGNNHHTHVEFVTHGVEFIHRRFVGVTHLGWSVDLFDAALESVKVHLHLVIRVWLY
jgi:hypothetical protein